MDIYENRVVAFVDILGFKEAVINESKAEKILCALTAIKDHVDSHIASDYYTRFTGVLDTEITAFSDSVVISGQESQALVVYLDALRFSEMLISSGFLCRGAISFGKLYHRGGLLFGQAFIDAFHAETKRSIFPRIIVDTEVERLIIESENVPGEFMHLLKRDFDGELYIDLGILNHLSNKSNYLESALNDIIDMNSECHDKAVKQKYEWLIRAYGLQAEDP